MPPLQAELIGSALPPFESNLAPSPDRALDNDPEITAGLVSEFRRDVIILAALDWAIEKADHHGLATIMAEHAAAIAMQRIEIHTLLSMAKTLTSEVPTDIEAEKSDLDLIFAFDPALTERERTKAREEEEQKTLLEERHREAQKLLKTGEQMAVVDPQTEYIPRVEAEIQPSLKEKAVAYMVNRLGFLSPFVPWEKPPTYHELNMVLREEQVQDLREVKENGVPAYSHDEMKLIRDAVIAFRTVNPAAEAELILKESARTPEDEREIDAVITLMERHVIDETSFLGLIEQRGLTKAVLDTMSAKAARAVRIMGENGEIITELPIDPAPELHWPY